MTPSREGSIAFLADAFVPASALPLALIGLGLFLLAIVIAAIALARAASFGDRQAASCRDDVTYRTQHREIDIDLDWDWKRPDSTVIPAGAFKSFTTRQEN